MADETLINGTDTNTDITITTTEHDSDQTVQKLTQKISLLEDQNESNKVKITQLEEEVQNHESDKRALSAIASRASELEGEVSRLQHDLVSSMSDGQEANAEARELKRQVEELKAKDIEKTEKLNLLVEKVKEKEGLVETKIAKKDEEIVKLNKEVEELKSVIVTLRQDIEKFSKEKDEFVKKCEKLEGEVVTLRSQVEAYEKINDDDSDVIVVDQLGWKGGLAVGSASLCAGALLTLMYYRHAKA